MRLTLVAAGGSPGEAGCDFPVRVGTAVLASGSQDRSAGRGCLGETDRLRDRRLDHVELISLRDGFQHRSSMQSATVVQRRQHAPHPERLVGEAAYVVDGVEELTNATVRERLALERDEYAGGRGQRGDREHAERRRAVEQHPVVDLSVVREVLEG